ncbi:hypothetical protein ULMS_13640 [Patiriisocius marinistellae]|uniref:Uncharacterized protein n=1 Tax=Patiriisocius marinistellae TaxID=2494560 RepID=A0A5J4G039_9FLAO|nr:DUF5606 domain-containing protein [Patiriisocius marinistellae]GEQ85856.1 hypothetical protein ULMS_13640 [Patiriisocius marinistellae]
MSLEKVLSISGKPGLYKLTTQTRSGFLAESLLDGKRINVSARHNVSLLSEIAIYTLTEEVPLRAVFEKIAKKEDGKATISHKVSKIELEEYFFGILPDYDEERVYASDIKKVVQWYNLLVKNDLTDFSEAEEAVEEEVKDKLTTPQRDAITGVSKTTSPKGGGKSSSKKGGTAKSTAARKK